MSEQIEEQNKQTLPEDKKKKNSSVKYIINIVLVLIITVVAIILSVKDNFNEVCTQLGNSDWKWILVILGIMVCVIFIRALILFCFARLYTRNYRFHQALAVEQIGTFYSGVTPGATGGQFMEAYVVGKQGIHVSSAVSMLAMYSILYQVALIVYGLISFIVKYDFIMGMDSIPFNIAGWSFSIPIWPLTIIGFLLNVGVIALLLLMSYWKKFHNFISGPCVSLLSKIKLVKNPDKTRESLKISVENFKLELRRLFTNIPFTILTLGFFAVFFTLKFCLPFFCGLALGNQTQASPELFWDAVFLSNYHQMVTGLIPLPGSAGISEYFFVKLFVNSVDPQKGFYFIAGATVEESVKLSSSLCSAALLIWRTFSFTLPLLIAGFVSAFYHVTPKAVEKSGGEMPSRDTYIEIQKETYAARESELNKTLQTGALSREAIMKRLKALNFQNKNKKPKKKKTSNNNTSDVEDDGFVEIDTSEEDK